MSAPEPETSRRPLAGGAVVIGGGPAGLTAAVELCRRNVPVTLLEKDRLVGGIARTESYQGYRFDIGGHRFFTKIGEVERFWRDLLGSEFITRPRISRIFYDGKFFDYPLKAMNALRNLGLLTSIQVVFSYLQSQVFPYPREDTFEEWVSNRFGKRLYRIFFKTYTEKVWGIPCSEIRAEFAAQRIQGLSLPVAVRNALFGPRQGKEVVKTLIEQFQYPRLGPGQMWEQAAEFVNQHGGQVCLEAEVVQVRHAGGRVTEVVTRTPRSPGENGAAPAHTATVPGAAFVSTMPISELICKLTPPAPAEVLAAAQGLTYRDFISVILIVNQPTLFPDNWIYVHSPKVKVGRIQNFKNWSPDMVPDPQRSALGLEYFCTEGDPLWQMSEAALIELGRREMAAIGLVKAEDVMDGTVVRQPKAYPVYNGTYAGYLETIKSYLAGFSNLQTVGRNGLHKYNNQDHSMLTAMLAVRNLLGEHHDVWSVNTERSYHEEIRVPHDALSSDEAGVAE
ncbi:MAG: NAD(P)/FAD-dependent oxidoreductase [Anaerolineales bacterium]|nr:NAD(P)/FAD-dependent oxidoreductase [Anaerolineales bacterium]